MKTRIYLLLIVTLCIAFGCDVTKQYFYEDVEKQKGEEMHTPPEFQNARYAKLNSIGCLEFNDMEKVKSGGSDTIDNLIRQNRCFVIPTDKDVFIAAIFKGDIVSAKFRGSTQLFYTLRTNLVQY